MRKLLLSSTTALCLLLAGTSPGNAQFFGGGIVLDPANLAQNVQQVLIAIQDGLRTLQQIELATRSVTGTDFSITPQIRKDLAGVQASLRQGLLIFDQLERVKQLEPLSADVFQALDDVGQIIAVLEQQNARILDLGGPLTASQAVSAATINDIIGNVEAVIDQSVIAQGETEATQLGNQLIAQEIGLLSQMYANQLASQQLQVMETNQRAAERAAARDIAERMRNKETFIECK